MELRRRIVDRVNAVGQHPRTRDDIRKRWNDLREKVPQPMSVERRCHHYPVPRQKRLPVITVTLDFWIRVTYQAHQGQLDSQSPKPTHRPPQSTPIRNQHHSTHPAYPHLCPQDTSISSVPTCTGTPVHTAPTRQSGTWGQCQWAHVQGTGAQVKRDTGRNALRQGEGRTRELTLQKALSEILGAYQHSQDTMGHILDNVQKNRRLQEGQYQGIREDLQAINNTLISIAGLLADMGNIMREAVSHERAPTTRQSTEQPSTSPAASGQEAPPQDPQATSIPPSAECEPPRKRSL
ncbi:hypothetical protein NDU88_002688 [Pleurodeles waltl]|uniref:Myb/SANT-like DNA-binding domain-containing protein n=1 Tax=Pleurodeles waltl TaxID=8319 RepID=A0AAV7UWB2_PLEWA|nr:hypothetical protein NDU88_002688 [Pleurodeles waltl]